MNSITRKENFDYTFTLTMEETDTISSVVRNLQTKNIVLTYDVNGLSKDHINGGCVAEIVFFGPGNYVFKDEHAGDIEIENGKIKFIEKTPRCFSEPMMIKIFTDKSRIDEINKANNSA